MISIGVFDGASTNLTSLSTLVGLGLFTSGYGNNVQLPAGHLNSYLQAYSYGAIEIENVITNVTTPGTLAAAGTPGAGNSGLITTDYTQLLKSVIAVSHLVGENIESEIAQTPVNWTSATFASYATQYRPVVDRSIDQVVSSTNAPDLVTAMRAETVNYNYAGVKYGPAGTAITATVSGSNPNYTLTFTSNAQNLAFLNILSNEFIANGYVNGTQSATAASLYTYTGTSRSINVAGVDAAITAVTPGSYTINVNVAAVITGGSQTIILYPYRIAGSATTVLLPKLSGFVGVPQFDYDGEIVGGFRRMDRMQGHWHEQWGASVNVTNSAGSNESMLSRTAGSNSAVNVAANTIRTATSDGTNGSPRTGKTTDPRTRGVYIYTWAGRLL